MMTICIATSNYLPDESGITTFNLHLSSLLLQAGHRVIILTVGPEQFETGEDEMIAEKNGLIVVRLKKTYYSFLKKYTSYFRPGGFNAPGFIAMGYAMRNWLSKNKNEYKIDITEVSDYGGLGIFLCDTGLPPVVITGHGSLLQYFPYTFAKKQEQAELIKQLEILSFRHADKVITHSPLNKEDLEQRTGVNVTVVSMPFIPPVNHVAPQSGKDGLVVGGMHLYKGPVYLADVMQRVKEIIPSFTVKWIGPDGFTDNSFKTVSNTIKNKYPDLWKTNFKWTGPKKHQETLNEINAAGIIIVPAVWETYNYIALEAAAIGKPVIITTGAGVFHLFVHEEDALIVPFNDAAVFADSIIRLYNDPALRKKISENAKKNIAKNFNPEKIVSQRMNIYQSVIEKPVNKTATEESLTFLNSYITPARKLYFAGRRILKKLGGRS